MHDKSQNDRLAEAIPMWPLRSQRDDERAVNGGYFHEQIHDAPVGRQEKRAAFRDERQPQRQ